MKTTLYVAIAVALLTFVVPVSGVRAHAGEPHGAVTPEEDTEKHLDRLPQFSQSEEPEHETGGFAWSRLIVPFGITTLSLLVLTFLAGWFMRIKRKLLFKWHRRLAIAALVAALCHALLVILFH